MQRKWELQLSGVDFGKTIHESTTTITNSQDVNKKVIDSQEILQVCHIRDFAGNPQPVSLPSCPLNLMADTKNTEKVSFLTGRSCESSTRHYWFASIYCRLVHLSCHSNESLQHRNKHKQHLNLNICTPLLLGFSTAEDIAEGDPSQDERIKIAGSYPVVI